ncbi:F-actin-capping protein subunit beta [Pantherophis guttatus]|uniref:F-actin-capping protein subunit beta n=1 Tax=Pantherophis guttatus TaxID=94885 RepID=A0A6P9C023_PANGU|nr:F-actin-capping protein subunit beta [Pantherophis guttatus]
MSEQQLDCALDLMRRLPPQQIEKNLSDLIDLVPSLCEDLLSSVDQPLKIARDKVVGKDYLLCDYNRDGDSYRSPWSNKYDPPLEDGAMPSARLRKLEVEANNAFDQYRDLYVDSFSDYLGSARQRFLAPLCRIQERLQFGHLGVKTCSWGAAVCVWRSLDWGASPGPVLP